MEWNGVVLLRRGDTMRHSSKETFFVTSSGWKESIFWEEWNQTQEYRENYFFNLLKGNLNKEFKYSWNNFGWEERQN